MEYTDKWQVYAEVYDRLFDYNKEIGEIGNTSARMAQLFMVIAALEEASEASGTGSYFDDNADNYLQIDHRDSESLADHLVKLGLIQRMGTKDGHVSTVVFQGCIDFAAGKPAPNIYGFKPYFTTPDDRGEAA